MGVCGTRVQGWASLGAAGPAGLWSTLLEPARYLLGSISEQSPMLSSHWAPPGVSRTVKDYANAAAPKILTWNTPFQSRLDNTEIMETHYWLPFYSLFPGFWVHGWKNHEADIGNQVLFCQMKTQNRTKLQPQSQSASLPKARHILKPKE